MSSHKGLPVVKTIYTYDFHELFLKYMIYLGFYFTILSQERKNYECKIISNFRN